MILTTFCISFNGELVRFGDWVNDFVGDISAQGKNELSWCIAQYSVRSVLHQLQIFPSQCYVKIKLYYLCF